MWHQIEANKKKTVLVILMMFILFGITGTAFGIYLFGDFHEGVLVLDAFLFIALIIMLITARKTAFMTLNKQMLVKCPQNSKSQLANVVKEMQIASGLSKCPEIYVLNSDVMNAFACATNEDNATIVVTKGLLKALNRDELQGVIAHEIAHIVNKDSAYLIYAGAFVTLIALFSNAACRCMPRRSSRNSNALVVLVAIIVLILAPLLTQLLYLLLSRKREYLADACAVQYTRYPLGLASALEKLEKNINTFDDNFLFDNSSNKNPFVKASCIVPLKAQEEQDSIFSTHPSTYNRIKVLKAMTNESINRADFGGYNVAYYKINGKRDLIPKKSMENLKKIPLRAAFVETSAVNSLANTSKINPKQEEFKKHRQTQDMIWNLKNYIFIECDCKTKFKIPPCYKGTKIKCPHCGKFYDVN
ncbi:M48 family metalloprotease [bacterium]|nr:M48 family metalloprotease [bacterium]